MTECGKLLHSCACLFFGVAWSICELMVVPFMVFPPPEFAFCPLSVCVQCCACHHFRFDFWLRVGGDWRDGEKPKRQWVSHLKGAVWMLFPPSSRQAFMQYHAAAPRKLLITYPSTGFCWKSCHQYEHISEFGMTLGSSKTPETTEHSPEW